MADHCFGTTGDLNLRCNFCFFLLRSQSADSHQLQGIKRQFSGKSCRERAEREGEGEEKKTPKAIRMG